MMTLGSHFEALRTHKNLVVTISEEKRLFEENLKLIMLRVNAATSLLKWAREEGNPALRSMVEKLYNITLMSATVQRQHAEQCLGFSKSLESILQVEQGLNAIRKQHNVSKKKMEDMQRQIDSCKRKSDLSKIKQLQEELIKHTSDEEELSAELQVKFVKGEIFKMKVLKTAFEELTNTRSENADKMKIVCNASTAVINDHPEVPSFLSSEEKEGKEKETPESQKAMTLLATSLGLPKKYTSFHAFAPSPKTIKPSAHPRGDSKLNHEDVKANLEEKSSDPPNLAESRNNQESKMKKRLSKLPAALAANFHRPKLKALKDKGKQSIGEEDGTDNFVVIQPISNATPISRPPALPTYSRRRSKSSIEIGAFRKIHGYPSPADIASDQQRRDEGDEFSDDNEYECPDYILPNSFNEDGPPLVRWSSDDALSKGTLPAYKEPLDVYTSLWLEESGNKEGSEPIYDSPYDLPYDAPNVSHLSSAPKKPLPETPLAASGPPKPKRGDIREAIYINTNDVEKLLNEIYDDSQLTQGVKPEVKKRALKKIRQERLQESQLSRDRQDSVIDLDVDVTSDQGNRENTDAEANYVNVSRSKSPRVVAESDDRAQPSQSKPVHQKQPPKVPVRPLNKLDVPEQHGRGNSPQLSPDASSSGVPIVQPQTKKNEDKIFRPKVPPKPGHSP